MDLKVAALASVELQKFKGFGQWLKCENGAAPNHFADEQQEYPGIRTYVEDAVVVAQRDSVPKVLSIFENLTVEHLHVRPRPVIDLAAVGKFHLLDSALHTAQAFSAAAASITRNVSIARYASVYEVQIGIVSILMRSRTAGTGASGCRGRRPA
jgi:hypothetical protein